MGYLEDDKQREVMADQLSQRSIRSNRGKDRFNLAILQCSHRSDVVYLGADEIESGRGNYDAPVLRPSYNNDNGLAEEEELAITNDNENTSGIAVNARQLDKAISGLLEMHRNQMFVEGADDDQLDFAISNMFLEDMLSARSNVERVIKLKTL